MGMEIGGACPGTLFIQIGSGNVPNGFYTVLGAIIGANIFLSLKKLLELSKFPTTYEQLMIVTHANRYSGLVAPFPVARMENDPSRSAEHAWQMLRTLMAGKKPASKLINVELTWRDEMLLSPQALKIENQQGTAL